MNLSQTVDAVLIHSVFYHKFNGISFAKFPIDLWENLCDWMGGKSISYVMEWSLGKVLKYANRNITCPWNSYMFIKVDNISMNTFSFEQSFIPSGKYRVDNYFMESKGSIPFITASLYFTVSDHRLEII